MSYKLIFSSMPATVSSPGLDNVLSSMFLVSLLRSDAHFEISDQLSDSELVVVTDCVTALTDWKDLIHSRHRDVCLQACYDEDECSPYILAEAAKSILSELQRFGVEVKWHRLSSDCADTLF